MLSRYYVLLFIWAVGIGWIGGGQIDEHVNGLAIDEINWHENVIIAEYANRVPDRGSEGPNELFWVNDVELVIEIVPVVVATTATGFVRVIGVDIVPENERKDLLRMGGWEEDVIEDAYDVVMCESRWNRMAENGVFKGLFQLELGTWFRHAGTDPQMWHDSLVNVQTAWKTYLYDRDRGYSAFNQWECKPRTPTHSAK